MDTLMGRYRNVSILAAAVFLQVIGLAIQVKSKPGDDRNNQESSRLIRVWTVAAVTPLEKGIVWLQTGTGNLWHNYIYLRGVRQENRALKDKIEQLQLEQVRLQQDATQARRLQSLLGFKEQFIDQTVAAQVIGSSGSEQSRTVYLDKGRDDGILEGMPVISAEGIVGKVILVEPRVSQVLLINDQTSGVGAILETSRLQGILKGKASGRLSLENIMSEEDVKPGEPVLTSGGDQIFPKGLPVGIVSEVKRGSEFLQITVKPATALTRLEEVLVITRKQERQVESAGASTVRASDILARRLPSVPDKPAEGAPAGQTSNVGTATGSVPTAAPAQARTTPPVSGPGGQGQLQGNPVATPLRPPQTKPGVATTSPGQSLPVRTTPTAVAPVKPDAGATQAQPQSEPQTQPGDTPQ